MLTLCPFQSTKLVNTGHLSMKRPTNKWIVVLTVFSSIVFIWSVRRMTCQMHTFSDSLWLEDCWNLIWSFNVFVISQLKRNKKMANACLDTWRIYAVFNFGNQTVIFLYGESSWCYWLLQSKIAHWRFIFREYLFLEWSERQCPHSSESYRKTFFARDTGKSIVLDIFDCASCFLTRITPKKDFKVIC